MFYFSTVSIRCWSSCCTAAASILHTHWLSRHQRRNGWTEVSKSLWPCQCNANYQFANDTQSLRSRMGICIDKDLFARQGNTSWVFYFHIPYDLVALLKTFLVSLMIWERRYQTQLGVLEPTFFKFVVLMQGTYELAWMHFPYHCKSTSCSSRTV